MTQEPTTYTGQYYYGTGRRKEAVARVRLYAGSGKIEINGRPYMEVLPRSILQERARKPGTAECPASSTSSPTEQRRGQQLG